MPGSFDAVLPINDHGCLSPSGPTGLAPGETGLRLDIWVFQKGAHVESKVAAACVAFLRDPFSGAKWMTTPDPNDDHFGVEFEPGPAVGMGLMVKKNENGEKIVEQWRTPIQLTM
jgi:hypothetical protein